MKYRNLQTSAILKTLFISTLLQWLANPGFAQTIPADSLYLGQTPPGNHPKIFNLAVSPGFFAAERITISRDGREIYYSDVRGYYPTNTPRIKKYTHSAGRWTGPAIVFEGYISPSLSVTGDTLYYQDGNYQSFLSIRNGSGWSNPVRVLSKLNTSHYLQGTDKGTLYVSSIPQNGIGANDWCRLSIHGNDTTAVSLGLPLNTTGYNYDFFISRDDSFMIIATPSGLQISYHKTDGGWTNPKGLGSTINFGQGMWGPYVSHDNKYLFYTTGTIADYSDTHVYWVRIDNMIDSLKHTNFLPYLKTKLQNQTGKVGESFSFTLPDSTFIDDDGNNTLTCDVSSRLPGWLNFDPETRTFTGIPTEAGNLNITIKAIDPEGTSASSSFSLKVENASSSMNQPLEQSFSCFPNPARDKIYLTFGTVDYSKATVSITDRIGEKVFFGTLHGSTTATINLQGNPAGVYFLKLDINGEAIYRKIILE
jgi:hypothetical protein